jgi:outer membrane receptor protein involved in Fe transport
VTLDGGVELYGSNWNSSGFLSEGEFAAHEYDIVSNPTDGGYKRRAQERMSLRVLSDAFVWRTTAYATLGRWQLFLTIPPAGGRFEGSGSQTEEEDSRAGYGATSALTWSGSARELTIGGETRWDRSNYENYFTTGRARDSSAALVTGRQLSGALFAQSHADLTTLVRIDAGLRLDALGTRSTPGEGEVVSASHVVLSPKVGALVRLSTEASVYANASRGFRSSNDIINDPTLTPITAWAYETGLKFDRGGVSASAALFRVEVSNEQTLNPITLVATNGGSSRRDGVELDWRLPLGALLTSTGSWTFTDARYRSLTSAPGEGDGEPTQLDGLRIFNTARYVGSSALQLTMKHPGVGVRVSGNWVGPYSPFDEPGAVVGGYGLLHASVTLPIDRTELALGVRNLLDRSYPELIAGHVVSPGQPQTVYFSLRTHF